MVAAVGPMARERAVHLHGRSPIKADATSTSAAASSASHEGTRHREMSGSSRAPLVDLPAVICLDAELGELLVERDALEADLVGR